MNKPQNPYPFSNVQGVTSDHMIEEYDMRHRFWQEGSDARQAEIDDLKLLLGRQEDKFWAQVIEDDRIIV